MSGQDATHRDDGLSFGEDQRLRNRVALVMILAVLVVGIFLTWGQSVTDVLRHAF